MEISWLKSFLSIARTRSFSASARECHITQPAFSRRIRAIENWVGAPLIDRSTYPTRLTPAGEQFLDVAHDIDTRLAGFRTELYNQRWRAEATIRLVAQHSLALNLLPAALQRCRTQTGDMLFAVTADNIHNCVELLKEDNADILLSFAMPGVTVMPDDGPFHHAVIGRDALVPVSRPDHDGRPDFALPGSPDAPIPWLSYGADAMLNHGISLLLARDDARCWLDPVLENPISEVLRRFALTGMGLAWLPASLIADDLRDGHLVVAGGPTWRLPMEVRAYRLAEGSRPVVDRAWALLTAADDPDQTMRSMHS